MTKRVIKADLNINEIEDPNPDWDWGTAPQPLYEIDNKLFEYASVLNEMIDDLETIYNNTKGWNNHEVDYGLRQTMSKLESGYSYLEEVRDEFFMESKKFQGLV